jgi:hypothetical protein
MKHLTAVLLLCLVVHALAQEVTEPRSGVKFAAKEGDATLLGTGLRTKTMLKVKVYAIGLYVSDAAVSGPLKGKAATPDLYRELLSGNFKKYVVMKFVRDVSAGQIRDAFRESMREAGPRVEDWLNNFNDLRSGQEIVIAWAPGAGLTTKVAGAEKPVVNNKTFASAVFGIWLGEKPVQDDIKKDLVSRAGELLK